MSEFGIKISVYPIKNDFFGDGVTVTGLITGNDLRKQLSGKELGQELLISKNMLKADENLFLDDMTTEEIENLLNVKVKIVENNGKDFIEKVLGIVV